MSASSTLETDVRSRLDPTLPTWLLVDPMLDDPLGLRAEPPEPSASTLTGMRDRVWQRSTTPVELHRSIALPARMHPYLVALQGLDDPWLARSTAMAHQEHRNAVADGLMGKGRSPHRFGGWLQSDRPESLAPMLTSITQLRVDAHTSARYLRIADRRTLDWLDCIVGAPTVARALLPLRTWVWIDGCGDVSTLPRPGAPSAPDAPGVGGIDEPLRLTRTQWSRFELAHLVHPTLARWRGECLLQGLVFGLDAARALARCEQAVGRAAHAAQRWPKVLAKDDDIVAWATLTLLHPDFEAGSRPVDRIERANSAGESFDSVCHDVRALFTSSDQAT